VRLAEVASHSSKKVKENGKMSNNINMVQISGNLGKAPEFKAEVGNGLATFQLAHNRFVPNQGESSNGSSGKAEYNKRTSWFRCVAWGNMAEKMAKLEKGARVVVTGRLESHSWQDKQGQLQSRVEIVVEDFRLVNSNKAAQTAEASDEVEEEERLVQATLDNAMVEAEEAEDEPPIGKSRSPKPAKSDKTATKPQPRPGIISGVPRREEASRQPVRMAAKGSRKGHQAK
jgi:single-strand DNA-binding protein